MYRFVEINRYKIDEVRKYAKIVFYLIYLTPVTQQRYVMRHGDCDTSDRDYGHF